MRNKSIEDYVNNIKELLFEKPKEIELILDILIQTSNKKNDIILLKRRYTEIIEKEKKGLEAYSETSQLKNILNNDILSLIDSLIEGDVTLYFNINNKNEVVYHLNDTIDGKPFEYIGELKRSLPNGTGRAYYKDASIFNGNFKEGMWHGHGVWINSAGEKYQSEWFNGAEKLNNDISKTLASIKGTGIEKSLKNILQSIESFNKNALLFDFMSVELNRIANRFSAFSDTGIFDRVINIEPSEIQKIFSGYINALSPGDEYFTITHLDFWSDRTLPHPRTFLDANVKVSKKGIKVHRVIMLERKFHDLNEEEKYMLSSHMEESIKISGLNTRIVELPKTHDLDRVSNTAVFKTKNGFELMIEMLYQKDKKDGERYLSNIKVITPKETIDNEYQRFSRWFNRGIEIGEYFSQNELFTFNVLFNKEGKAIDLVPSNSTIDDSMWKELAEEVHKESDLIDFDAAELKDRWEKQMAAICVDDEGIVGYVSLIDLFNKTRFEEVLLDNNIEFDELTSTRIFEFQSGWTRTGMRKKRISTLLRKRLMNKHRIAYSSFLCLTCGLSSSPVAARMNWHVIPWSKYKFITPLIGKFDYTKSNYDATFALNSLPLNGKKTYNDSRIDLDNFDTIPEDKWKNHFFLWVEHDYILGELNEKISSIVKNDLSQWKKIVEVVNK